MLILAILFLLSLAGYLLNRYRKAAQRQKAQDEQMYRLAALAATERRRIDSELFSRK